MNARISNGDNNQCELESDKVQSEEESFRDSFPELSPKKRPKTVKRYGSLMDFQDKALTDWERKKRDKALKKNKLKKEDLSVPELSGRSLSDSDFAARWIVATREARKALKLGKRLASLILELKGEFWRKQPFDYAQNLDVLLILDQGNGGCKLGYSLWLLGVCIS
ncbi:hypothetical protein GQ457_15G027150 [Hibiscus cannabinus]